MTNLYSRLGSPWKCPIFLYDFKIIWIQLQTDFYKNCERKFHGNLFCRSRTDICVHEEINRRFCDYAKSACKVGLTSDSIAIESNTPQLRYNKPTASFYATESNIIRNGWNFSESSQDSWSNIIEFVGEIETIFTI